jgi:hypothetical protein
MNMFLLASGTLWVYVFYRLAGRDSPYLLPDLFTDSTALFNVSHFPNHGNNLSRVILKPLPQWDILDTSSMIVFAGNFLLAIRQARRVYSPTLVLESLRNMP